MRPGSKLCKQLVRGTMALQACMKLAGAMVLRIVIIEDNKPLASGIAHRLRDQGHAVDVLHDGSEGDAFLSTEGADMVILDINLPGMSGFEIVRAMRRRHDATPVLALTARSSVLDRVEGLDAGADDYLIKPFEMDELEARIRALSRRRGAPLKDVLTIGNVRFDVGARLVTAGTEPVQLRRQELAAFECLIERRGNLVPKSVLIEQIYGVGADVEDKVIEAPISRLRKKLADHGVTIRSARGLGYLMDDR